jgi:hypothetical protein
LIEFLGVWVSCLNPTYHYFFSNVPESIQEYIEGKGIPATLSSPLLASFSDTQNLLPIVQISDTSIWHGSVMENGLTGVNITPLNLTQVGSAKIDLSQISFSDAGSSEVSIAQVSTPQIGLSDKSITQVSSAQIGILEPSFFKASTSQTSVAQISSLQIDTSQISIIQNNASQVGFSQASSLQINAGKVSFSRSISSQQFLSTFFSSHDSTASVLYDINNTALILWNTYLQPTTPLNLNIEITDLPTGQLAEANITGFDPTGRPNSGTLYLDTDANGLGWYIDPTPWDNSEFSTSLTDTAYRATPDSLAYGHYDLLTTLLHETSHLQGFIAGYSNFDTHIQTLNSSKTPGLSEVEAFVGDGFDFAQPRRQPPQLIGLPLRPDEHHPHPRRPQTALRSGYPNPHRHP